LAITTEYVLAPSLPLRIISKLSDSTFCQVSPNLSSISILTFLVAELTSSSPLPLPKVIDGTAVVPSYAGSALPSI
jgi:hypothetical protein